MTIKFYDTYWPDCYEEIITFYPRFYRDILEMVAVLHAHGHLADGMQASIEQTFLNCFVQAADANKIRTWERILGITHTEGLTLDQRRKVVIARMSGYGHIGEPEIRGIIANYTDAPVFVDFGGGIITVVIDGEVFSEDSLLETLLQRIPAHLRLDMSININRVFRQKIDIGFAGAIGSHYTGRPVTKDRTSTLRHRTAGGSFLYSRITSKLKE